MYKLSLITLKKNGFFSIYLSSILSKVVTLFGGIIIVRLLSQDDYSIYALVINAISILTFFGDFGSSSATLQFVIENKDDRNKKIAFALFGLKVALAASILSSILILLSKFFYPYKSVIVSNYTIMLFLVPIMTTIINFIGIILRSKEENKVYSFYQFISVFFHYVIIVIFIFLFGLIGSFLAQYCYNFIILLFGIFILFKIIKGKITKENINKSEKKEFLKLAFGSQINNTITSALYTIDVFVIALFAIPDKELAIYKVATIIPNALSFLPQCLMIFLIPYFVKNYKNIIWIKKNIKRIVKYGFICYGSITVMLIILSKYIITLLYGPEYTNSAYIFNVILISFFINSTFKIPISNMLYCMHKVNINILISGISLVCNFVLNLIFIKIIGSVGAAYATVLVSIIMALLNIYYLIKELRRIER